jgi:hypothetical protein
MVDETRLVINEDGASREAQKLVPLLAQVDSITRTRRVIVKIPVYRVQDYRGMRRRAAFLTEAASRILGFMA